MKNPPGGDAVSCPHVRSNPQTEATARRDRRLGRAVGNRWLTWLTGMRVIPFGLDAVIFGSATVIIE
jgi:hypothetical protein